MSHKMSNGEEQNKRNILRLIENKRKSSISARTIFIQRERHVTHNDEQR